MSLQQIFRKELEKIQVDNRYISEQVKKGKGSPDNHWGYA